MATEKEKLIERYNEKIAGTDSAIAGKNKVKAAITNEPDWENDEDYVEQVEELDSEIASLNARKPEYQEVVDLLSA